MSDGEAPQAACRVPVTPPERAAQRFTGAGAGTPTVTSALPIAPPSVVVTITWPVPTAVTTPPELTVATVGFGLVHARLGLSIELPRESCAVTVTVCVVPAPLS